MMQEAPTDSVQDAAVSPPLEADSSLFDSTQVNDDIVGEFSRGITETGQLLVSGEWEMVLSQFYTSLVEVGVNFIPKFISALFVLVLFYLAYRILRKLITRIFSRSSFIEPGLESLVIKTYGVVAWVFITIMVLAQFGINVTALLAGLSIVGIAVGFAAQDTVQNFISGITILVDRPFRVGHYIQIDSTFGRVEEITLRSTRLRTLNNEMMVMPNTQMINQKLLNHTELGFLRVDIDFGIAYKEFPDEARKIVYPLTDNDTRLHPTHKPQVVVTSLGGSSVDMQLRVFLQDASLAAQIRCEYTEKIREALRKADIEIPFPHLQLFIDEAKAFQEASFMASQSE